MPMTRPQFLALAQDQRVHESDAPEFIQEEFEIWLQDDHGNLHPDDDREELWEKYLEEIERRSPDPLYPRFNFTPVQIWKSHATHTIAKSTSKPSSSPH